DSGCDRPPTVAALSCRELSDECADEPRFVPLLCFCLPSLKFQVFDFGFVIIILVRSNRVNSIHRLLSNKPLTNLNSEIKNQKCYFPVFPGFSFNCTSA